MNAAQNNAKTITVRVLGCGSSGGVPRIGNRWGDCDPNEPKNRRSRCSLLVTKQNKAGEKTRILVDTSPDMREQLLRADCGALDAVLFTHDHADQTHGLDDLRPLSYMGKKRVPVYLDAATRKTLFVRFAYAFEQAAGSAYPAILDSRAMPPLGEVFTIGGAGGDVPITPFLLDHGPTVQSLGFRFGGIAYTPDVSDIPAASIAALEGLDVWIVDALRRTAHPTHFHLEQTLQWIDKMQPKLAILTNMHIDMDYQTLCKELPDNVIPAFDGIEVSI